MLLIKAAKFIICTYILFIMSYVELILAESFGKFQFLLILYAGGNYLPEYNFQHYWDYLHSLQF